MQTDRKKAAIYCRVAHRNDDELERQRESLRRFAAAQGYGECAEYLDNGTDGLTLDRPSLNRLNDAIANEEIQIVFVQDTSRIGRRIPAVFTWLSFTKALDVEVVSQNEDIDFCTASFSALLDAMKRR
jgi:DNA invertase Pin-like site-specific DNA recombinase